MNRFYERINQINEIQMRETLKLKKKHAQSLKVIIFSLNINISFSQKFSKITNQSQPKSGPILQSVAVPLTFTAQFSQHNSQ